MDKTNNSSSSSKSRSNTLFKICVPSYNTRQWVDKCLSSIEKQTYKNFTVIVIDDCSNEQGDKSKEIIADYCDKNKWSYLFNVQRKFALFNIYNGINLIAKDEHDVIVMVDGDDWLFDEFVLEKVNEQYVNNDIYLTYGQYVESANPNNNSRYFCKTPDVNVQKDRSYRKYPWAFTHLKTFKYGLFKRIIPQHLKNVHGNMFETASDLAIMFPMMEMAGSRFKCLDDILYVYNTENPISDFRVAKEDQAHTDGIIRRLPKYPIITL